jgi:hypothetical protein
LLCVHIPALKKEKLHTNFTGEHTMGRDCWGQREGDGKKIYLRKTGVQDVNWTEELPVFA